MSGHSKYDDMARECLYGCYAERADEAAFQRMVSLIAALVRRAVEDARAEEREACMKDVCPSCRAGTPLEGGPQFQHVRRDWHEVNYCKAERIRARGEKEESDATR